MGRYKTSFPEKSNSHFSDISMQSNRSEEETASNLEGICIIAHMSGPHTIYIEQSGLYIIKKENKHIIVEKDGSVPFEAATHIMRASNYVWHNSDTHERLEKITPQTIQKIKRARRLGCRIKEEIDVYRKEEQLFKLEEEKMYLNLDIHVALKLLEKKYEYLKTRKNGIDFQTNQRFY